MTMPVFTHDCSKCEFIDHILGMDVYVCKGCIGGPSLIARMSSDGPDYSSIPVKLFKEQLRENGPVTCHGTYGETTFRKMVMENNELPHYRAFLLALALNDPLP